MSLYNEDTKIKDLLDDERAVNIIEKYIPGFTKHPLLPIAKTMTIRKAMKYQKNLNMSDETASQMRDELFSLVEER